MKFVVKLKLLMMEKLDSKLKMKLVPGIPQCC